jgi:integrase
LISPGLVAFTGLRMGELRALHWRDVDFPRTVVRVRGGYAQGAPSAPKSGNFRSVPMVPDVAQQLARLSEREDWTGDEDLVFAAADGGWLNDDKLRRRYRKAPRRSRPHRLRAAVETSPRRMISGPEPVSAPGAPSRC